MTMAAPTMGEDEARRETELARKDMQSGLDRLRRVYREGGWISMRYSKWQDYLADQFPNLPRVEREDRPELFAALAEDGMSQREIAATTGVSNATVSRSTSVTDVTDVDLDEPAEEPVEKRPRARPIKDPAPSIPYSKRPPLSPMELLEQATKARDSMREFVREFDRAGKPELGDTALKLLLMTFEETEAAVSWGRSLITGSESELSGDLLDRWAREQNT